MLSFHSKMQRCLLVDILNIEVGMPLEQKPSVTMHVKRPRDVAMSRDTLAQQSNQGTYCTFKKCILLIIHAFSPGTFI